MLTINTYINKSLIFIYLRNNLLVIEDIIIRLLKSVLCSYLFE
jgi:hypothetical protein